MTPQKRAKFITKWIQNYAKRHKIDHLVVGISGGIDSAVVSTLCAETGVDTIVVSMPIHQRAEQHYLSDNHGKWLQGKYKNVTHVTVDLTRTFDAFKDNFRVLPNLLALANSRSRLRMACLYQIAQSHAGIVVGTGNKVEDFGVGFYTKYGDGGVDISPIGDCMKTEVWDMGRALGVDQDIIDAAPTDGLWDDGRTDQDQLQGISYPELERAMMQDTTGTKPEGKREREVLKQYREIRAKTQHKMQPIPVCMMPAEEETASKKPAKKAAKKTAKKTAKSSRKLEKTAGFPNILLVK
jgi:NAD+ synthase